MLNVIKYVSACIEKNHGTIFLYYVNVVLNLVCSYFAEDFDIYILQGYLIVVFNFSCAFLKLEFGIRVKLASLSEFGSVPLHFFEKFEKICINSFSNVWEHLPVKPSGLFFIERCMITDLNSKVVVGWFRLYISS